MALNLSVAAKAIEDGGNCEEHESSFSELNVTPFIECSTPLVVLRKGTVTDNSLTMDMRVTQQDMGGTEIKAALPAKRLGDCTK